MGESLILNEGQPPFAELTVANGNLTVHRAGSPLLRSACLALLVVPVCTLVAVGLMVFFACLFIAVTEFSGVALLVVGVFGLALVITVRALALLQGSIFPFEVVLGHGCYRLNNGLVRSSQRFNPTEAEVIICPFVSKDCWAYEALIRVRRGAWERVLIPTTFIGSKRQALQIATRIRDWLQDKSLVNRVILSQWGEIAKAATDPASQEEFPEDGKHSFGTRLKYDHQFRQRAIIMLGTVIVLSAWGIIGLHYLLTRH
ncbi:MAG TPA: hypothetical protein VN765_16915 [Candidatus Acidoferrum sp.]|nr:hypothetical protein [Candidatus Acidoferrum sp.]